MRCVASVVACASRSVPPSASGLARRTVPHCDSSLRPYDVPPLRPDGSGGLAARFRQRISMFRRALIIAAVLVYLAVLAITVPRGDSATNTPVSHGLNSAESY